MRQKLISLKQQQEQHLNNNNNSSRTSQNDFKPVQK